VRIAHTKGEHVWHVHDDTDEFFLVLDGQFDIAMRDAGGVGGVILMFEPSGTRTTGDRYEGEIPGNVDSTTGHELA
jgi:hypothetical protein